MVPFCQVLKAAVVSPTPQIQPWGGCRGAAVGTWSAGELCCVLGETPMGTRLMEGDFDQATKANLIPSS